MQNIRRRRAASCIIGGICDTNIKTGATVGNHPISESLYARFGAYWNSDLDGKRSAGIQINIEKNQCCGIRKIRNIKKNTMHTQLIKLWKNVKQILYWERIQEGEKKRKRALALEVICLIILLNLVSKLQRCAT